LPASGKKAVANAVYQQLKNEGFKIERLDSHDVRPLFPEIGFAPPDVDRHVRRSGHLCSMLEKNGVAVVASFVSPYRPSREFVRSITVNFVEVYMRATAEACEKRDTKGHYRKARAGEYRFFPGVDINYEAPLNPEVVIDVDDTTLDQATEQIIRYLKRSVLSSKYQKLAVGKQAKIQWPQSADN